MPGLPGRACPAPRGRRDAPSPQDMRCPLLRKTAMTIDLIQKYPGAGSFKFGDSDAMCAELIALVRAGKKTATCGRVADFEDDGCGLPVVGRCDIASNWDGSPAVVIRTVSVERMTFDEIGEEFALAEGENETYAGWRRDHRAYFERNGGWAGDMEMICERFEVVEDLADMEPVDGGQNAHPTDGRES